MSETTLQSNFNNLVKDISCLYPKHEAISIAYIVVEHVLNYSKFKYAEHRNELFPSEAKKLWNKILMELITGKPIQYIIGATPFYGYKFEVSPVVLIPRQETEELVDIILKENTNVLLQVLDIGTGSGCIPVSLKARRDKWKVFATDISNEAIAIAKKNAVLNNTTIEFFEDDIFNSTVFKEKQKFNIIVSNPPYIPLNEKIKMHKNVIEFEPHIALFSPDEDAVKYYRAISAFAGQFLVKGGKLYVEIHENFGKEVSEILKRNNFEKIDIIQDINGKQRIVKAILS
jgi:release factor glutamine methyltransferase